MAPFELHLAPLGSGSRLSSGRTARQRARERETGGADGWRIIEIIEIIENDPRPIIEIIEIIENGPRDYRNYRNIIEIIEKGPPRL